MLEQKVTCEDCGEDYPPSWPHNCIGVSADADSVQVERVVRAQLPAEGELVAVRYRNNFDGEGDIDYQLAYQKKGVWYEYHDGYELIEYVGDEILEWFSMKPGAGFKPAP